MTMKTKVNIHTRNGEWYSADDMYGVTSEQAQNAIATILKYCTIQRRSEQGCFGCKITSFCDMAGVIGGFVNEIDIDYANGKREVWFSA